MKDTTNIQEQELEKRWNKGGHGKGGWGTEDYDKVGKHHSTEELAGLIDQDTEKEVHHADGEVGEQDPESLVEGEEHKHEHKEFKLNDEEFPSLS